MKTITTIGLLFLLNQFPAYAECFQRKICLDSVESDCEVKISNGLMKYEIAVQGLAELRCREKTYVSVSPRRYEVFYNYYDQKQPLNETWTYSERLAHPSASYATSLKAYNACLKMKASLQQKIAVCYQD